MGKLSCVEGLSLSSQSYILNDMFKNRLRGFTSKNDNVSQAKSTSFLVLANLENKKILFTFSEQLSI